MLDKEAVRIFYLSGYNAVEIAKKTGGEVEAIRKCIQRNYRHLKHNHERVVLQRKEELKAIRYESKKYISDKSFVLKNRSVYKTLPNGDIVLNKEVAGTVTWDTPRRLPNDNKCII